MSKKIYRVTEDEEFSYLQDRVWGDEEVVEVGIDDVTLTELINACDSDFENANYHRMVGVTEKITDQITEVAGSDVAKLVLWKLVTENGFLWGGD